MRSKYTKPRDRFRVYVTEHEAPGFMDIIYISTVGSVCQGYPVPLSLVQAIRRFFTMRFQTSLTVFLCSITFAESESGTSKTCPSWSSSLIEFSGSFQQPAPPKVHSEFTTSFIQHKWFSSSIPSLTVIVLTRLNRNVNLSHITSGYISNSPKNLQVRVDEAFAGTLASSIFNYANVSTEGQVDNTLTSTTSSDLTNSEQFRGYVTPNFPLWAEDVLQGNGAVFGGLVTREFAVEKVASVSAKFFTNHYL
jgi:hypothetical protein